MNLKIPPIPSSELTPYRLYLNRRSFIKLGGSLALGAALTACLPESSSSTLSGPLDEIGNPLTSFDFVTNYVNFYEFTTNKNGVAALAKDFTLSPWTIEVGGLVQKPTTFHIEDIITRFPSEERIYRMRCVEGWSMVIPWQGFKLNQLLALVEPMSSARYVKFTTVYRPAEMPGQQLGSYPWPYTEGLRLDEAMHPLTILSTGLYDQDLLPQNGAPLRLVVPWKYGLKSIKSIVKIELTEDQPPTLWNTIAPDEYGFYGNVNPDVSHPRWSQATERPVGEAERKATLLFNGYTEEVGQMYSNMDLTKDF